MKSIDPSKHEARLMFQDPAPGSHGHEALRQEAEGFLELVDVDLR